MSISRHEVKVTTTGAAGLADGSAQTPHIQGRVVAVHLDYTGQPATTDVIVRTKGVPSETILTVTSALTDAWYYPRRLGSDGAGAALTGWYEAFTVYDHVEVVVAQGDPAGVVNATILVEE